MAVEVFLIRHGQTPNNITGERIYNAGLTALGRAQAGALARALREREVTAVVSSPLLRAMETASTIAAATTLPLDVSNDLVEINRWDPYVGAPSDELGRRFPQARLEPGMPRDGWSYPGPEPADMARRRVRRVVSWVAAFPAGTTVALVAHGTFNGLLLAAWVGSPLEGAPNFTQDNACINHLTITPGGVAVHRLNDTRHLAGTGTPPT